MRDTNIDAAEVTKFNRLAHQWWDLKGQFKPLHEINPLRLTFVKSTTMLTEKSVIDIGCGGGILTESLALHDGQVTGIDLAEDVLAVAKAHAEENALDIQYKKISAEDMAAEYPHQFDVVTCMELLEHVPNPQSLVTACATLVKPGGHVFFSTLNRHPKAYLFAILGAEYVLKLLPRGTHDYQKFLRPAELNHFIQQAGLKTTSMKGMSYSPLTKQYRLSDDLKVNYLVHAKLHGPLPSQGKR